MFEAIHSERSTATPATVWALWRDAERWPEWNEAIEWAELHGELAVGTNATVKFKRGGKMHFTITELEPERLLTDEARLFGCRFGHEHVVKPRGGGCEITHRLYIQGPTSALFSRLFGRKRLEESVAGFVERERELTE